METKVIIDEKDDYEIELGDKTIAHILLGMLEKKGVDAYVYDKHPLKTGTSIHVSGATPKAKLKAAVADAEKEWATLKKTLATVK